MLRLFASALFPRALLFSLFAFFFLDMMPVFLVGAIKMCHGGIPRQARDDSASRQYLPSGMTNDMAFF